VSNSAKRGVREVGRRPTILSRVVSATGVQVDRLIGSAPDDHLAARPLCGVSPASLGRVDCAGSCPAIGARGVSATGVKPEVRFAEPAPDDHLGSSPYRAVLLSWARRVDSAYGYPGVRCGIVSAAVA
jgi:hypothetical protein